MKKRTILALLLCLALLLTGCSAAPNGNYAGGAPASKDELAGVENSGNPSSGVLADRKLIRRVNMEAETEDLDALLGHLTDRISQLGGYVESRNIQNGSAYSGRRYRSANLVIRIPAAKLDEFVRGVGENSNVVSTRETSDDVTLQYVDTESRLKVLRTEEARLLEFLGNAVSIAEMLEVEQRLTKVQSEIESLTAQLKTYDNLVDYGTVTLNINEVEVYTPVAEPGLWQEIQETFGESLTGLGEIGEGLLIFLLGYSPYLLVLAVIGGGIWLFIWNFDRRQKKKARKKNTIE